jgi:hypothetical protein
MSRSRQERVPSLAEVFGLSLRPSHDRISASSMTRVVHSGRNTSFVTVEGSGVMPMAASSKRSFVAGLVMRLPASA